MEEKIAHAKELIEDTVKKYKRTAVACSFGKDSMVTVHLAREVDPHIPIFSIMTPYKPRETFDYLKEMNRQMNLDVTVYIVSDSIPEAFQDNNLDLRLLPHEEFHRTASKIKDEKGSEIYDVDPDECCRLLKVEPTIIAVKYLDAWICGLRNTEGRVRENYQEVEEKGGLTKINPILTFTEEEVLQYLQDHQIPLHPWYTTELPDGRRYRSLGCEPCTKPILEEQLEREGRWQNTSKCGGECGIHTQRLR
ncbi:MAG: phosphoadenosine phosphosulfate reductase family protein [Deltaproteobacteria bacterium]|nr:phosphoadenosine phosphosulfate reductase family protein [Deltaproteobacteria bacterium]